MMLHSHINDYNVDFCHDFSFVDELNEIPDKIVVADKNVYDLYKEKVFDVFSQEDIHLIEAVENNKTIEAALGICSRMVRIPAKRNATIISFGGGIVQDITGFAASILYRGIKWIFVPTTLLSQADSCIGSKTSLNYLNRKNLLGTFYPPNHILVDTGFLSTLTIQDYCSGMGEIVKLHTMNGITYFDELEKAMNGLLARDNRALNLYVRKSLELKKMLIEEDEFDRGIRQLLNYGHTFGHAIESIMEFSVPHGLAVLIGMAMANIVSEHRNLIEKGARERIEGIIHKLIVTAKLAPLRFGLEGMKNAISNDKKKIGKGLPAVLLKNDFSLMKVDDVTEDEILMAINEIYRIF